MRIFAARTVTGEIRFVKKLGSDTSAAVVGRGTIEVVPEPGRVVILNGASSVGKSTLIRGFVDSRAATGDCGIPVGIDDFIAKRPWQWFDIPKVGGPYGQDCLRFEAGADRMVPTVGDLGRTLSPSIDELWPPGLGAVSTLWWTR
jgi:hypothetical protein